MLATIRPDGRPRLMPIAFAHATATDPPALTLYSALDEKPKSVDDPRRLARVRDVISRPQVSVLVDRWSEDWTQLAWLRLDGDAELLEPANDYGAGKEGAAEHARAVGLLRAKYAQYASHDLEHRPMLRITVRAIAGWSAR